MAATSTAALIRAGAKVALAVPGVAGLQPRLTHRLTETVSPVLPQTAGVRAEHAPDGSGWHIEVRCVVAEENRVLEIARSVHDQVRSAVLAHLAEQSALEVVAVTVTIVRIAARQPERARLE
ncbi:Asp23/Gls24 family envelope stress response protein [Streptomyces sp. NPDC101151]|uniref:Asp23/Gls24 family envelope stress response protein n=1 Tax=Streptomyces sp. NPDC101151 TaxID=3366115 RepID=UPI003801649D